MSQHQYARNAVAGGFDLLSSLAKSVETALPGKTFRLAMTETQAEFTFDETLSAPDVTTLATTVSAHRSTALLPSVKAKKLAAIDGRTRELIAEGFTYSATVFSLSLEAQAKMLAAFQTRNDAGYVYPEVWNSIDDTSEVSLADAPAIKALVKAGHVARRGHLDSGTALKQQVRAAADVAAVLAVTDTR